MNMGEINATEKADRKKPTGKSPPPKRAGGFQVHKKVGFSESQLLRGRKVDFFVKSQLVRGRGVGFLAKPDLFGEA